MSDAALKLLEQIRALPDEDQQLLAEELARGPDESDFLTELENDSEFQAMLADRVRQAEEHPELLLDGDEVLAEGRRRLREKRA